MTKDQVEAQVLNLINEYIGNSVDGITTIKGEHKLLDDLNLDSLDMIELTIAFEQEFSIEVSDEEAAGALTVAGVIDLIVKKTGADGQ